MSAAAQLSHEVYELVARLLVEIDGKPLTGIVSVPVPLAPLSVFLGALPRDHSVLWDAAYEQTAYAAAGVAQKIELSGTDRFAQMERGLSQLWSRVVPFPHPGCEPLPPRVFGGVSFVPGGSNEPPWDEFSDGCFVLPRWTYQRNLAAQKAVLSLAADGERDHGVPRHQAILAELESILDALAAYEGVPSQRSNWPAAPPFTGVQVNQVSLEWWRAHIERLKEGIRHGRFEKIVAARRAEVELPAEVNDLDVLARLSAEPNCTRFAFRGAHSTFLGATPETLFTKRGNTLKTQALAGTIRSLGSEFPVLSKRSNELLSSEKDLFEHRFVVEHICASLEPLSTSIDVQTHPDVSKIRTILHLNTPIQARLKPEIGAPQVLASLHPTPAVGGVPRGEAVEWIAANELHARSWYTGAVGWVDITGDACFVVAIRCGLIRHRTAYIFTGAGIVESSEADAEYSETELKQLPLLRAVGIAT